MKKHAIFIVPLFALSLSCINLQADVSDAQVRSLETRVNALEQKKGANAMVNPSGRPQVRDGVDLFFTADCLLWQAHENGLGYAIKAEEDQPTASALYDSSVKNMDFNWNFGFRVGLGWNTPHDGWDVTTNWTWFQNKANRNLKAGSDDILLPTNQFAAGSTAVGYKNSTAKWKLLLNMIDLEMGREFFVSKWMTLRPFIGLRNVWINQKDTITFNKAEPTGAQHASLTRGENNYWGIGPRSGLNTQWGLGHGFSIFGNAAFSLLYGFFDVEAYQNRTLTSGGATNTVVSNSDGIRVGRAISELALGLRWDTMFASDCCHFGIQGGWEHLMFFGQNQFKNFSGVAANNAGAAFANQGDLTIQGYTLSARLDF